MGELCSAGVWRAATCVLAAGWVVIACGGGGDDMTVGAPDVAVVSAQPAAVLSTASVRPDARNEPCRPLPQAVPVARRDTARLEREFVEELRGEMAVGVGTGAGSVHVGDPFEAR